MNIVWDETERRRKYLEVSFVRGYSHSSLILLGSAALVKIDDGITKDGTGYWLDCECCL